MNSAWAEKFCRKTP